MRAALHAGLLDQDLVLWAEAGGEGTAQVAAADATGPRPRDARRRRGGSSAPPPWGLPAETVAAALASEVPDLPLQALRPCTVVAWLPAAAGRPVPSSPLLGAAVPAATETPLAAWTVQALRLAPGPAVTLLAWVADRDALGAGYLVGADLRFWAEALRLGGSLAVRQLFLPALSPDGGRAVWRPVLAGRTAEVANRLAGQMPGACRALGPEAAGSQPAIPARALLGQFLAMVVDHLAREAPQGPPPVVDSVHDAWLQALRSPDGTMRGAPAELSALASAAARWAAPLEAGADAAWRLCLRLEEPPEEQETWRLRYLLQAGDDPSLQLAAEDLWKEPGRGRLSLPEAVGASLPTLRAALLAALGRAAALSTEIAGSLENPRPSGCPLTTVQAHAFLSQTAWLLDEAGCVLQLPAWWTRGRGGARLTVRGRATPRLQAPAGLGLDEALNFSWEVALGDEVLSGEELAALAALKSPLVRLRGQWVEVRAREIEAALALREGRGTPRSGTLADALRLGAGLEAAGGLEVTEVRAQGWLAELLGGGTDREAEPSPPPGLRGTLRPYQLRGYAWLRELGRLGLGACLADDMGLGKTIQTLALILRDRDDGGPRPVLLVCPTSVVGNWLREAQRFAPDLRVLAHHGPERLQGEAFASAATAQDLVVTTYALLPRDLESLRAVPWRALVLDEAQNVKNAGTKQARAARALGARCRIALTGTPVENNVGDLWSLMEFLNPGLLGSQAEFRRRFFLPIQVQRDPEAMARLRRLTAPFVLRRLKTDPAVAAELPDKQEMTVFCTLTREQASLYAAILRDVEESLREQGMEGIQRRGLILATLTKLKQVCNHPAHLLGDHSALEGRSGKLSRLTEMLEEVLAGGERALVFTQFQEMGALLQEHLQETLGREVLFLHGGVPRAKREEMVLRFGSERGAASPVFVLSLRAGGTGLNLTAANHVFHFDRWWNPAVENQATDRAFRLGQRRNVQVHKFVCAGTVEERIDSLIAGKRELAEKVVGAGEMWLTELSNAELRELFALEAGAVAD